ncbi:hypothetical protein F3I16_00210 [Pseudomonas sp. L-22-4S-12]|nr:hypothetical protein [Pseudomonas sp. L-22-4S-12]
MVLMDGSSVALQSMLEGRPARKLRRVTPATFLSALLVWFCSQKPQAQGGALLGQVVGRGDATRLLESPNQVERIQAAPASRLLVGDVRPEFAFQLVPDLQNRVSARRAQTEAGIRWPGPDSPADRFFWGATKV